MVQLADKTAADYQGATDFLYQEHNNMATQRMIHGKTFPQWYPDK
ncbi:hypothetical protein [uncultured Microbulbifer sp.]|nr:hypothetical protein [uncultured Microbulbifer sp.]